jgi:hypothetical protein
MSLERFDIAGVDGRVLEQYKASPRLLALLRALIDGPSAEVRAALVQLLGRLDIDAMEGVQLDLIGRIVGRPRPDVFDPILVQDSGFFAFRDLTDPNDPDLGFDSLVGVGENTFALIGLDEDDNPEPSALSKGFGAIGENVGGLFASTEGVIMPEPVTRRFEGAPFRGVEPEKEMSDADYRELLKATIFANNANATVQELEFYGGFVLGVTVTIVNRFTAIDLEIAKRLTIQERSIIDNTLLPAAGIRIETVKVANGEGAFGFVGNPNSVGFGAVGVEQIGAGFARVA